MSHIHRLCFKLSKKNDLELICYPTKLWTKTIVHVKTRPASNCKLSFFLSFKNAATSLANKGYYLLLILIRAFLRKIQQ